MRDAKNHPEGHGGANDNALALSLWSLTGSRPLTRACCGMEAKLHLIRNLLFLMQATAPPATTHLALSLCSLTESRPLKWACMCGLEAKLHLSAIYHSCYPKSSQCKYDTSIKVYAVNVFRVLIRVVHQINFILCIHSPCSAYNSFA